MCICEVYIYGRLNQIIYHLSGEHCVAPACGWQLPQNAAIAVAINGRYNNNNNSDNSDNANFTTVGICCVG